MPSWLYFPWSESVKKLSCRYLLQRYLGQFLEEKLSLDQLTVDLYNGIGSVSNVTLDVQALNELGEQHNLPVEFVDGFISEIKVGIPWSSLLTESSSLEVNGLNLVIQPKQRADSGASMFESTWSSMTSSIQLAEECLKQSPEESERLHAVNGVEDFAKTIDSILARVKIQFHNTTIRVEHLTRETAKGAAIEVQIKQFSYFDETSNEAFDEANARPTSAYSVKMFSVEGVELYTNEFYASHRTISRSLLIESSLTEDNSEIPDRRKIDHDIVMFGKLIGRQELRMRVKQKDNISGPKVDFELNMSSFVLYLSPRQARTICEVICGLMSPHLQDTSNVVNKTRHNQKPMTTSDFERVEHELNQHINPTTNFTNFVSKSLQNTTCWSSGGVEDESDDEFHPVKGVGSGSQASSIANSVSSSYSSSTSSYQLSSKLSDYYGTSQSSRHFHSRHKEKGASDTDFNGEFSNFQIRLNLLTFILLHEDVLRSADESLVPDDASVEKMCSMSRHFFNQFASIHAKSYGTNDFKYGKSMVQNSLDRNHFRLYCCTVVVNGEERSNSTNIETQGSLTVANAELVECLMELKDKQLEIVELIQFIRSESGFSKDSSVFSRPNVNLHFKHCKYLKHFTLPKVTELNIKLEDCRTEIDVTIIDRLSDVINNFTSLSKSLIKPTANPNNFGVPFNDAHTISADYKLDWKILSPSMSIKLRFPIPDLRSECDEYCPYWYRRSVYNDILLIELTDASIQGLGSPQKLGQSVELLCKSVKISFQEANCDKPVPFLLSGVDETSANSSLPNAAGKNFGWPRLVLNLRPKNSCIELEEEDEEDDRGEEAAHGGGSLFRSVMKKEPSPFTAKMVFRESDTSHPKSTNSNDGEEIVLPGSKEEIEEFVEYANHNALIQVNVSLPAVTVQIPSKHFYEVLYNRVNNDLMLWVPISSKRKSNQNVGYPGQSNFNFNFNSSSSMLTSFSLCKSMKKNHSDSDDEGNGNENLLINMDAVAENRKKKHVSSHQQSNVTVSVFVTQGILDIFPHARDSSGKVIPGQFGEIQLLFNEADLFFVSGHKSDPLLNYICLRINHVSLYHCSLLPSNTDVSLKSINAYPSKHVVPTIYKTPEGGIVNENCNAVGTGSASSDDMLTLAIRGLGSENRLKNICVANSLNCVTIRHRMKASYTSWLSQLIDFFDVVDYPILHYQPWKVVTQLHQQFVNCLIDYRPLHIPLKAALTVEYFNISSNLTAKTSTSILRLIAEEGTLFLSRTAGDKKADDPEDLLIDLRNDYVCVIDMGLFDLSLRLSDSEEGPQTDLRASNNIVHIRTCADSAVALMDLVKYIASDGDLCDANAQSEYEQSTSALRELNEQVLINLKTGKSDDCASTTAAGTTTASSSSISSEGDADNGVPFLVEEAMNDTTWFDNSPKRRSAGSKRRDQGPVEVFYFPDEENVRIGLTDECVPSSTNSQSSDDDFEADFCVIDAEVGVGYLGKSNVPEVRLLTKETIRMVDNHFTMPISKVDVLKAPKSYPQPVSKYTLREMTIVWHMYGGHDFFKSDENETTADAAKRHTSSSGSDPSSKSSQESLNSNRDEDRIPTLKKTSLDSLNVTFNALRMNDLHAVNFGLPRSSSRVSFAESLTDSPTVLYDKHKNSMWQARGGPHRDHDSLMKLKLTKLKYQYEIYPKDTKQACRQVLLVQDVEIGDRMASSQINKFLYQYSSSTRPKQSNANMVVIKATNIRPEPNVSHLQECCLRVSLLPLRLNIDQDSLQFLFTFFNEISGNGKGEEKSTTVSRPIAPPVMNIENINIADSSAMMVDTDAILPTTVSSPSNSPLFIRSFVFSPEVPIRLDYEGKHVDLSLGPLAGLIMGLGQLNCSELKLKRIYHRQGFLGLEKLVSYVLGEWLQDIKTNQLPSLLGGVGPMHSLVQLVQGIRDLFWLPIEQYQKDGRIVRGLQRGANSFTTSSAVALLEITARLVYAIQRLAETAFDIVSPGPSIKYIRYHERNDRNKRRSQRHYNQPADIREGFATALQLVKEGIGETAETLVRVASIEHEVKGAVGAVGGVLKEIPSTAIKPIILASQATTNVLDGVRSQLVPDARQEAALKWRTDYF